MALNDLDFLLLSSLVLIINHHTVEEQQCWASAEGATPRNKHPIIRHAELAKQCKHAYIRVRRSVADVGIMRFEVGQCQDSRGIILR